jgi:diguanylate cyclase (GGDEF)-like protein
VLALPSDKQGQRSVPGLETHVPLKALLLSLVALAVAALASLVWPESLQELATLVWLLALIPSFLFAYYRGWEGAAGGLAAAMALLILIEIVPGLLTGTRVDWRIAAGLTVVFIAASLGAGSIAELLRRQKLGALQLAYADSLTALPNRRVVEFFLRHHFAGAQRGNKLAVVMFDIDGFKAYNDQFGHNAGDEALREFAEILKVQTRTSDLSGRYGGEEFLTVLPSTELNGGRIFAERVRDALARHQLPTGAQITVSAGVAAFEPTMAEADNLVKAADALLYTAKAEGGNRVAPRRGAPATGESTEAVAASTD